MNAIRPCCALYRYAWLNNSIHNTNRMPYMLASGMQMQETVVLYI